MDKIIITMIIGVLLSLNVKSQVENWDVYLAQYEDGPGSVTLNMDLIKSSLIGDLPYILIAGVNYKNCRDDGFPQNDEYRNLYQISDDIQAVILKATKSILAGTFTYQCNRSDYFYIQDTSGIRDLLTGIYTSKYLDYEYRINIKPDRNWDAYKKFLYPNEETQEYMSNQKVINQLQSSGDNLTKERQVDHWIYFPNKSNMDQFLEYALKEGFKEESKGKIKKSELPFQLQISRIDYVDPESINKVTLLLRRKAKELNGDYDGWETFVIRE